MIKYKISKDLIDHALQLSNPMKELNNSYRGSAANFVGILGELVAEKWFTEQGINFIADKAKTHDYRISHDGRTIDVKTKDRSVAPLPAYDCSVPLYNHSFQLPDYYLFVSLQRTGGRTTGRNQEFKPYNFHTAFIVGAANQHLMHKHGLIWRAGEVDPTNNTKFWTDCLNVYVNQLRTPSSFAETLKESKPEIPLWTSQFMEYLKRTGQEAICSTGFQKHLKRR